MIIATGKTALINSLPRDTIGKNVELSTAAEATWGNIQSNSEVGSGAKDTVTLRKTGFQSGGSASHPAWSARERAINELVYN